MTTLGIDGARGGWFAVALHADDTWGIGLHTRFEELMATYPDAAPALIDIPIGLPESGPRQCDQEARRLLGPRGRSVFPVPCRGAVHAPDYATACRRNERALGRRLNRQTWNICPRIAEVDTFLRAHPEKIGILREAHPELAFSALNRGRPMPHSKKTPEGLAERRAVLRTHLPAADAIFEEATACFRRKDLARDDILDALVLAVAARGPLIAVPEEPETDTFGLPMEIAYPGLP
ncbi:MAG TPA: DUF429 domain-containing protein [Gammaproteobacteria bacterium]|nr:DUF429 domain-containing protein [Gammaproteobacteria bacterium]